MKKSQRLNLKLRVTANEKKRYFTIYVNNFVYRTDKLSEHDFNIYWFNTTLEWVLLSQTTSVLNLIKVRKNGI